MSKSDKLYSHSPSIKKDSEGKAKLEKPTRAAKTDIGLEGNPLPHNDSEEAPHNETQEVQMPIQVKQVADMHERHMQEMKDMHKRHQTEHKKLAEDHAGTDASGQSLINKTEGTA